MTFNHVLSVDQFSRIRIEALFAAVWNLEQNSWKLFPPNKEKYFIPQNDVMSQLTMASVFYEPSTRTRLSFETAFLTLGGKVTTVENAFDNSSDKKGESYLDTIKTISQIADVIVLRHPKMGSVFEAAEIASCPIINAGDGAGEHPTQALIDLYTIWREKGKIDGLKVTIIGDLTHARTINSLKKILSLYQVEIQEVDLEDDKRFDGYPDLSDTDVVYMTRRQIERRQNEQTPLLGPNPLDVTTLKEDAIILHPLPRGSELPVAIDDDPRAKYWQQVKNSVKVRQAVLLYAFGVA